MEYRDLIRYSLTLLGMELISLVSWIVFERGTSFTDSVVLATGATVITAIRETKK